MGIFALDLRAVDRELLPQVLDATECRVQHFAKVHEHLNTSIDSCDPPLSASLPIAPIPFKVNRTQML